MKRHTYRPMSEAPRDGTPIVAVCGGVEMPVYWGADFPGGGAWVYFDEDEDDGGYARVRSEPTGWRPMPGMRG
jgi:hypothetical protein